MQAFVSRLAVVMEAMPSVDFMQCNNRNEDRRGTLICRHANGPASGTGGDADADAEGRRMRQLASWARV